MAVGSVVGLGNIWRFPFLAFESGGAAFLVVYLAAVLVIAIPVVFAEFVIGRRANVDAIGAFRELGHSRWRFVGAIGVLASFWTLSYYSVVGGWVARYVLGSATGNALAAPKGYFGPVSAGIPAVLAPAVFIAITIVIVAVGIEREIELATKFMVPSIVVCSSSRSSPRRCPMLARAVPFSSRRISTPSPRTRRVSFPRRSARRSFRSCSDSAS